MIKNKIKDFLPSIIAVLIALIIGGMIMITKGVHPFTAYTDMMRAAFYQTSPRSPLFSGLAKVDSGTYFIDNDELENNTPKLIKEKGLSHIPEDRHKRATIDDFTMEENMALGLQDQYSKGLLLDYSEIEKKTDEYIEKYDIRPTDGKIKFGGLSGGNQQKVVVARELERENKFIIAAQPTRGVDIGAIEMIHNTILNEKTQKKAIMLVSAELSEIMALSDRIAVMYSGRIVGVLDRKDATTEKIGILMAGGKIDD